MHDLPTGSALDQHHGGVASFGHSPLSIKMHCGAVLSAAMTSGTTAATRVERP